MKCLRYFFFILLFETTFIIQFSSCNTGPTQEEIIEAKIQELKEKNEEEIEARVQEELRLKNEKKKQEKTRKKNGYYRKNILKFLNPHTNNFGKDAVFGGIWDLQVKMDNKTPYLLDVVGVNVNYYKANGGLYKTETVTFRNILPGKRIIIEAPGSDKGVSVKCFVQYVKSTALGL
ncbi:MAG: hypothetical protein AB8E82_17330 [Aureispira sp.]